MKFLKLIFPFILIVGALTAFSPTDTVKIESSESKALKSFKVQNLEQTPETAKAYELITKLQNQKNSIQEIIDSVFNKLDSISTDTTGHHNKKVLSNRAGSIKGNKVRQYKQDKRTDNFQAKNSGNLFAIQHNTETSGFPDRKQYFESQKQSFEENSISANSNYSYHNYTFFYSINGAFKERFCINDRRFSHNGRTVDIFKG